MDTKVTPAVKDSAPVTEKKELADALKKADKLKSSCVAKLANCLGLERCIPTDSTWGFANNDQNLGQLARLLGKVQTTPFIDKWLLVDSSTLKEQCQPSELFSNLRDGVVTYAAAVDDCFEFAGKLKKMKKAMA